MIFLVLDEQKISELEEFFLFYRWKKLNNNETVIRLVTSWATEEKMILSFLNEL
jgi:threonine aldolase